MFTRTILCTLLAVVCCAGTVSAVSFEITPFVAARTTGEFDDIVTPLISEVEIDSGTSFGVTFGMDLTDNWQIELLYSTQTSDFSATPAVGPVEELGDIDSTMIHVGGLYHFKDPIDTLRPFVSFSVGGMTFDPEAFEDDTKFSLSLGGGAKYMINDRIGLRFQGRLITSEINDEDELYCDPFFGCYVVEDSNFLTQFEVAAGLVIRFGD
jgi:outer membrane protein W